MPKIKIRPVDMAKIHRAHGLAEYGPCQFAYCSCPEFKESEESELVCGNPRHDRQYHEKRT